MADDIEEKPTEAEHGENDGKKKKKKDKKNKKHDVDPEQEPTEHEENEKKKKKKKKDKKDIASPAADEEGNPNVGVIEEGPTLDQGDEGHKIQEMHEGEKKKKKKKKNTEENDSPEGEEVNKEGDAETEPKQSGGEKKKKKKKKEEEAADPGEESGDKKPEGREPVSHAHAENDDNDKTKEKKKKKKPREDVSVNGEERGNEKKGKIEQSEGNVIKTEEQDNEKQEEKKNRKKDKKKKKKEIVGEESEGKQPNHEKESSEKKKKIKEEKKEKKNNDMDDKKESRTQLSAKGNTKTILSDETYQKVLLLAETFARVSKSAREHNMKISKTNDTLTKMEEVLTRLETTQNTYQFIWKIDNFKEHFMAARTGKKMAVYCPEVESHRYGYKIGITLCPNGDGVGLNTHMSLFFCILRGKYDDILPWPFSCSLRFSLMDQRPPKKNKRRDNIVGIFTPNASPSNELFLGKPTSARNKGLGLPRFAALNTIFENEEKYILDDTIFIKIEIDLNGLETRMDERVKI